MNLLPWILLGASIGAIGMALYLVGWGRRTTYRTRRDK